MLKSVKEATLAEIMTVRRTPFAEGEKQRCNSAAIRLMPPYLTWVHGLINTIKFTPSQFAMLHPRAKGGRNQ